MPRVMKQASTTQRLATSAPIHWFSLSKVNPVIRYLVLTVITPK
jgi:hypothetical protein